MNRIRVLTSGTLFLFSLYCLFFNHTLPFSLSIEIYMIAFIYFAFFPIKDMLSFANLSLYKGRQFEKNYIPNPELQQQEFIIVVWNVVSIIGIHFFNTVFLSLFPMS